MPCRIMSTVVVHVASGIRDISSLLGRIAEAAPRLTEALCYNRPNMRHIAPFSEL